MSIPLHSAQPSSKAASSVALSASAGGSAGAAFFVASGSFGPSLKRARLVILLDAHAWPKSGNGFIRIVLSRGLVDVHSGFSQ